MATLPPASYAPVIKHNIEGLYISLFIEREEQMFLMTADCFQVLQTEQSLFQTPAFTKLTSF